LATEIPARKAGFVLYYSSARYALFLNENENDFFFKIWLIIVDEKSSILI